MPKFSSKFLILNFLCLRLNHMLFETFEWSFHNQLIEKDGRELNFLSFCLPRFCISTEHLPNQFFHSSTSFDCHNEALPLDLLWSFCVLSQSINYTTCHHSWFNSKVFYDYYFDLFLPFWCSLECKQGWPEHFLYHINLKLSDALIVTLQLLEDLPCKYQVHGQHIFLALKARFLTHELTCVYRHSILQELFGILLGCVLLQALPSLKRLGHQPESKVSVSNAEPISTLLAILEASMPLKEWPVRHPQVMLEFHLLAYLVHQLTALLVE